MYNSVGFRNRVIACENLDDTHVESTDPSEIIRNPYIDGYIFGPCDLAGSIGKLPNYKDPENVALIKEAIAILKDHHKCIGLSIGSIDPEEVRCWRDMGINMISSGGDYNYVVAGAKKFLADFRKQQ